MQHSIESWHLKIKKKNDMINLTIEIKMTKKNRVIHNLNKKLRDEIRN